MKTFLSKLLHRKPANTSLALKRLKIRMGDGADYLEIDIEGVIDLVPFSSITYVNFNQKTDVLCIYGVLGWVLRLSNISRPYDGPALVKIIERLTRYWATK